ncbi:MAG: hypothetical protein HOP11_05485 [Saprospiraceae bacterium]|nr:hypothetical protein [Saprospiraceae bacterium]
MNKFILYIINLINRRKVVIVAVASLVFRVETIHSQIFNCSEIDSTTCKVIKKVVQSKIIVEKKIESQDTIYNYQVPNLADIDNDCIPEIIILDKDFNSINFMDSKTGLLKSKIRIPIVSPTLSKFAIADIDRDGILEIIVLATIFNPNPNNIKGKLVCLHLDGSQLWVSDRRVDIYNQTRDMPEGAIGLADFNQDGNTEVYVNNKIFNGQTGVLLCEGSDGIGRDYTIDFSPDGVSVAAQLDENLNDLELAAGFTIYKVKIINKIGQVGNSMTTNNISINGNYRDGYTSVADINLDGRLDVVVTSPGINNQAIIYAYTFNFGLCSLLSTANISGNDYSGTGIATIGMIGSLTNPSIIIKRFCKLISYHYDGSNNLNLDWTIQTSDSSGGAGISIFDLNGDGFNEIIYRDETEFKIYEVLTSTPNLIFKFVCTSGTGNEAPLIGDIDNSGHSKICITCGSINNAYFGKLTVFGGPDGQEWAPARPIWNQYAYNPLYINDDLTVPQYPKNQATYMNGKYNNFMQQESLLDSNGMYKVAAASLLGDITCINYDPLKDEYVITYNVINKKDASRSSGDRWHISFYDGDPENGGIVIDSILMTKDLIAGDTLHDLMFNFKRSGIKQLFMVVNTSRLGGGAFDDKDFKVLECDYKDNISQWIDFPIVKEIKDVFCESQGYKYKDSTYTSTGKYYYIVRNALGCDQEVAILDLEARDSVIQDLFYSACDSIRLIDTTFYNSGSKTYLFNTSYGCDSTIIAHIEIKNSNVNNTSAISCDSILWNGKILKQSGNYSYITNNINACDSTTNLDLTIHNSKIIDQYKSSCNSYSWNGSTYTQSGDYTHQANTINGCDSTTILHLTIDTLVRESINITECQSYNWNGRLITTTGIYLDTFRTINGCDSIVSLDLNIANNRSSLSQISCDQYAWNNILLTQSGIYYDTLKNIQGCDSIAQLNLTINRSNTNTAFINSCINFNWKNKNLTQSGIYRDTTSTSLGCDSISILNLTIHQAYDTSISIKSCESYTWNGQAITQSGQYQYKGLTQRNCDSTIQLNLTINKNSLSNINLSVCDSISILGTTYNKAGNYTIKSMNNTGCDSTINLTLSILSQKIIENKSSCDSFIWNNEIYTQSGTYSNKNTNINGCDSTHQLNLTIHPSFKNKITAQDCKEYYWPSNNTIYNQSGIYQAKYNTSKGCDSTLTLNLTIHPDFEKSDTITTNTKYQWPINLKTYNQSGTYQESYRDINGCDSIYKLLLIIIDEDIEIYTPNVINPSSIDGNNRFTLYDNGTRATINLLSIYDRWGGLLWQKQNFPTNNPNEGWDGTSNNVKLNPGVYVWYANVLTPKGRKIVLKGDVTIVR